MSATESSLPTFTVLEQGVCAAAGFRAAGVAAGIKRSGGLDLVLLVSDLPASVAATYTSHPAAAAPVHVSRARSAGGAARGVVVNSGCANAVTGKQGQADAEEMAAAAAAAAGLAPGEMLVCSTGKIGTFLPMDKVHSGITQAAGALGTDDLAVAQAILTTDTRPKRAAVAHPDGWTLGGMTKGAGMIAPDMSAGKSATMLAFITTDAAVAPEVLQAALSSAVAGSFNRITVDGEPSTNDTVLAFANGASGITPSPATISAALDAVCASLAEAIVRDGEGATKFVRVNVTGAASTADAERAARSIADSPLVKCALYGADANWGRVVAAVGKARVAFELDAMTVSMGGVTLFDHGPVTDPGAEAQAHEALLAHDVTVTCHLAAGEAAAEILTTDLSVGYVECNADYEP